VPLELLFYHKIKQTIRVCYDNLVSSNTNKQNHDLLVPIRPKVSNALSISSVFWLSSIFNILSMAASRFVTPNKRRY